MNPEEIITKAVTNALEPILKSEFTNRQKALILLSLVETANNIITKNFIKVK